MVKALPELGDGPFFHVNSDTIWIDGVKPNLIRLAAAFDPARMDALLLLAPATTSIGYTGRGDFAMAPDGKLTRRGERDVVPFVYAGAAILTPAFFAGVPPGPSSMSPLFDRADRSRAALRPAPRRPLDACRHARCREGRRGRDRRQRGVAHDLEKWTPVFGQDRARTKEIALEFDPIRWIKLQARQLPTCALV